MQKDSGTMSGPQAAVQSAAQPELLLALHTSALSSCLQSPESNDSIYVSVI